MGKLKYTTEQVGFLLDKVADKTILPKNEYDVYLDIPEKYVEYFTTDKYLNEIEGMEIEDVEQLLTLMINIDIASLQGWDVVNIYLNESKATSLVLQPMTDIYLVGVPLEMIGELQENGGISLGFVKHTIIVENGIGIWGVLPPPIKISTTRLGNNNLSEDGKKAMTWIERYGYNTFVCYFTKQGLSWGSVAKQASSVVDTGGELPLVVIWADVDHKMDIVRLYKVKDEYTLTQATTTYEVIVSPETFQSLLDRVTALETQINKEYDKAN